MARNVLLATISGSSTYDYGLWDAGDCSADLRVVGAGRTVQAGASGGKADKGMCRSTVALASGKWYVEAVLHSLDLLAARLAFGLAPGAAALTTRVGWHATSYALYEDGTKRNNGTSGGALFASFAAASTLQVVGMAVDLDAGRVWWSLNGAWAGDPAAGTGAAYTGLSGTYHLAGSCDDIAQPFNGLTLRTAPGELAYPPPAGFSPGWYDVGVADEHVGTESYTTHHDDALRPNVVYSGRVRKASLVYERGVSCRFWGGGGVRRSLGVVDLRAGDRGIDSWLSQAWRDRVLRLDQVNSSGRFDAGQTVGEMLIDRLEATDRRTFRLVLRDRLAAAERALQTNIYPGSTPVVELRGSPKPLTIGRCDFVPMLATDTALSLHQVHDAVPHTVHAVYDKGGLLTAGVGYSVETDGQIKRLTAIVGRQVATISGQRRADGTLMERLPEVLVELLQTRGGLPTQQLDLSSAIALDVARPLKLGIHLRDESRVVDVVSRVMESFNGALWEDAFGILHAWRLAAPAATADYTLTDVQIMTDIRRTLDGAPGLSTSIVGARNYGVHGDADLIGSVVGTALGEQLKAEWLGRKVYGGTALHPSYAHAEDAAPWETLISDTTQLQAVIDEQAGLYTVERHFYELSAQLGTAGALSIAPGDTVEVVSRQLGLDAGKKLMVVWARTLPGSGRVDLKLWG